MSIRNNRRATSSTADLTSLVDVVLVILVVLASQSTIGLAVDANELHVGSGSQYQSTTKLESVITIDGDNKIRFNDRIVNLQTLTDTIAARQAAGNSRFVIAGETKADYGTFLDVEDALKKCGVTGYDRLHKQKGE